MAKTNYNKMSTKSKEDVKKEVEPVIEEVVSEIEETVETAPIPIPDYKEGVVIDCVKLNMRIAPKVDSKIRGTLDKGDTVIILGEEGDFYKIGNPENPDYCMKKYISVK